MQDLAKPENGEVVALCKLFFFPHFHSHLHNLWITRFVRIAAVHLRLPSFDRGLTSFLWAFGFGLFLWLGMLAIGVEGATAFIFSVLSAGAIFFFVRLFGDDEIRRAR